AASTRQIGESRDELRRRAAEILEPVLDAAGKHEELVTTLEMRLRSETDVQERAGTLRTIAKVAEESLKDLSRAHGALLRALAEQPAETGLHDDIERIAGLMGQEGWARYADTLGERSASIFDAKVTAGLFMRLGKIAEVHLSDMPRAAEAYARAAEQGGD